MSVKTQHTQPTVTSSAVEKSQPLVPQLRFAEFEGYWNKKKLGELGFFKNGLNKDKKDFGFGNPFVNLMDVFGKSILDNSNFDLVNANEKDLLLYDLRKGDVLFIRSSVKREGVGETILVFKDLEETVYSGFLIRFREKANNLYLYFKRYCFANRPFRKELLSYATSSANTNINQESLSQISLKYPTLPEQQKIASFLTAVDTKLQQLTSKKELLQQYKKGVMQQLFSQQLRFKPVLSGVEGQTDGSDYPDWEEKKLGDFCTFFSGGTPKSTNKEYYSGDIPFIGSGDIYDSIVDSFISEEALNNSSAKIVKVGDLLYALYGANSGELAISQIEGAINQAILCIRSKENINYIYYLLFYNKDRIVAKFLQGGQGNLSSKIIKNLKYKFPSKEEQQQIASYLTLLDTKIETVTQQIENTQGFKKGLLQQLFV